MSDQVSQKSIAVLTSGGDAPGMNPAIRSVVRVGISKGLQVFGYFRGYRGLIDNDFTELNMRSVANIIQRGGTFLKSERCPEFLNPEYRAKAASNLTKKNISGLIVIGGDGSLKGALELSRGHNIQVVGIPGTIDNDLWGTDQSIGFDTAVNTALDAIDRIRDTATSHNRLFIVEVMGRDSGHIAVHVGLAGGAEEVFTPEVPVPLETAITHIQRGAESGKLASLLITAEGQKPGRAYDLAEALRKKAGLDAKVCILGHIQRGGAPTATDRILASRLGEAAVLELLKGQSQVMVGLENQRVVSHPIADCISREKPLQQDLISLSRVLSH